MGAVLNLTDLRERRAALRLAKKKVVFTNGCFDLIHRGHIEYLAKSKALGDVLVVGVNSDSSIRRIKGPSRPIVGDQDRAFVVANLAPVDFVTIFNEDTPLELITALVPDVLVKGADWAIDKIIGKDVVERAGGLVKAIEFTSGYSTSKIIEHIMEHNKVH
ncbi:MAG TPA: D-glycero-beta-D-manno-heptose 1-phosphate adenylyltransferase [Bacteroidota bacterium]|nr:D-glycero-beta-D-manno-heptose 1-phosphate adenylyltransferase [Bacteroidota bacterium]